MTESKQRGNVRISEEKGEAGKLVSVRVAR